MASLEIVWAGLVLLGTAVVGVVAHELSHAVGLQFAGVGCRMELLPERDGASRFRTSLLGPIATVTPTRIPNDVSRWHLRGAALAPLSLALPLGLVAAGVLPGPPVLDELSLQLAAIAWLGCSLPSPRDFSIAWYPERAIDVHRSTE